MSSKTFEQFGLTDRRVNLPCPDCGKNMLYFSSNDCIICDNSNGCDRYVVFARKRN